MWTHFVICSNEQDVSGHRFRHGKDNLSFMHKCSSIIVLRRSKRGEKDEIHHRPALIKQYSTY